jgi:hypothetical protein
MLTFPDLFYYTTIHYVLIYYKIEEQDLKIWNYTSGNIQKCHLKMAASTILNF